MALRNKLHKQQSGCANIYGQARPGQFITWCLSGGHTSTDRLEPGDCNERIVATSRVTSQAIKMHGTKPNQSLSNSSSVTVQTVGAKLGISMAGMAIPIKYINSNADLVLVLGTQLSGSAPACNVYKWIIHFCLGRMCHTTSWHRLTWAPFPVSSEPR